MKDFFLDNLIGIFGRISIFGTGRSGPQLHAVESGGGFKWETRGITREPSETMKSFTIWVDYSHLLSQRASRKLWEGIALAYIIISQHLAHTGILYKIRYAATYNAPTNRQSRSRNQPLQSADGRNDLGNESCHVNWSGHLQYSSIWFTNMTWILSSYVYIYIDMINNIMQCNIIYI